MDETKLKHFLSHTKVWDYAKMSEQDYKEMSAVDHFALLQDYYIYMSKKMGTGIFFVLIFCILLLSVFLVCFAFSIKKALKTFILLL